MRWIALLVLACSSPAWADSSWESGLDFHGTDAAFGARRPVGLAGGVRYGETEGRVVFDPLVFFLGWEMLDVTAGRWIAGDRIELIGGWRQTSGRIGTGRRYDEALLVGADWLVPRTGRFRLQFGFEFEVSLVRHGGNIPDDDITFSPLSEDLLTRMEILLHARFEFTGAL